MKRGTLVLTRTQIRQLHELRKREGSFLSYDQFKLAMEAPFTSQTLLNAMQGKPVHPATYNFLVAFIRKWLPLAHRQDGKTSAAGNDTAEDNAQAIGNANDTVTHRGSR